MAHPAERPFARAEASINAYRASSDLDAAEDAWRDFLHYWVRTVNKYDAHGQSLYGSAWKQLKKNLRSDDRLTFLWEARNTDEHSISAVAERTPRVALLDPISIDIGDGLASGSGGEAGIDLGGFALVFSAGSLCLVEVQNPIRRETYQPPLEDGRPMTPLRLMEYGHAFMRTILA